MRTASSIHKRFLFTTLALLGIGFLIFSSASLGLLSRDGATYSQVATSQFVLGILCGLIGLTIAARIPLALIARAAPYLFTLGLLGTLLVFIPGLGFAYGGAHRWIHIFGISVQPSEFLKMGAVIFYATLLTRVYNRISSPRALLPLFFVLGLSGACILAQRDTGTFLVLASALVAMYFVAGAPLRYFALLAVLFTILLGSLILARPYVLERIKTFVDPSHDPRGSSYQLRQSLIAVGSGGFAGRGFGQSIQKFNYLPEPIGDSIFPVAAEEFGFLGASGILALFTLFGFFGFSIARRAKTPFGVFLAAGLISLLLAQALINIGAMIGIIPLTGVPLVFISHGGTALFSALCAVGLVLNVSRNTSSR